MTDLAELLKMSGSLSDRLVSTGAKGTTRPAAGGTTAAVGLGVAVDEGTATWAIAIAVGVAGTAEGTAVKGSVGESIGDAIGVGVGDGC